MSSVRWRCARDGPTHVSGLIISSAVADEVMAHARAELPNEACGLLSGIGGGAARFHPARNIEASPFGFEMDAGDLLRILAGMERAGQELVAIVHSHPRSPAVPSARDIAESHYPVIQLIVSLSDARATAREALRGWRIEDGIASEVSLLVEPDQQPLADRSTSEPARASMSSSTAQDPSSPPER